VTDELVEHIDESGAVLAVVSRAEMRANRLRHRCVYIAVTTSGDELVVHRRADWKDVWPGRWDLAFGGVVTVGEEWADAATRELAEEAGIDGPRLREVGSGSYTDDDVAVLGRVYRVEWDGALDFADGEVAESAVVRLEDLDGWLAGRSMCPDSVALVRPLLP